MTQTISQPECDEFTSVIVTKLPSFTTKNASKFRQCDLQSDRTGPPLFRRMHDADTEVGSDFCFDAVFSDAGFSVTRLRFLRSPDAVDSDDDHAGYNDDGDDAWDENLGERQPCRQH
jgi:hypothetical protein